MRRALVSLLLAAGACASALQPRLVAAQETDPLGSSRACGYRVLEGGGITRREGQLIIIDDAFRVTCDDGAFVRAERGTVDQVTRVVTLIGSVYFEDATRSLSSDHATYDANQGVLHATGNVDFTDRVEGTTLTGPELEYYRATETRSEALVNAMGRPRLTLTQRPVGAAADSGEAAPSDSLPGQPVEPAADPKVAAADTSGMPLTIDADRMTIEGRNDLTAFGNVVIQDDEMRALADEAEQRGSSETLELRGNAQIHSREYSLAADVIFATVPEGSIEDVEATGHARMLGEDLNVAAPRMTMFFADDLLQRSVARSDPALAPGVQPLATSPTFRLQADSIDAGLPGQRLEVVVAIGEARGEMIDTTRVAVASADSGAVARADSLGAEDDGPSPALPDAPGALGENAAVGGAEPLNASGDSASLARTDPLQTRDEGETADAGGVEARFAGGDSITTLSAAELVENDWITGDTITGYFASVVATPVDSATAAEGEGEPGPEDEDSPAAVEVDGELVVNDSATAGQDTTLVLQRLVATGKAQSLYHVAPEEGSPPGTLSGINYLSAARIELIFEGGQVQVADVTGLSRGLYLDPLAAQTEEGEGEEAAAEEASGPETTPETPPSDELPGNDAAPADPAGPVEPAGAAAMAAQRRGEDQ